MADPFLIAAVGFKLGSAIFAKKASKKRKKSRKLLADIQRIRNRQAKIRFLKSFREAQANALISGVASGALRGSGTRGTVSSQQSQVGFGLFEQEQQALLADRSGKALDQADNRAFQANLFGQAANIAASFAPD